MIKVAASLGYQPAPKGSTPALIIYDGSPIDLELLIREDRKKLPDAKIFVYDDYPDYQAATLLDYDNKTFYDVKHYDQTNLKLSLQRRLANED